MNKQGTNKQTIFPYHNTLKAFRPVLHLVLRITWAFTAQCEGKTIKEENEAFVATTSSMPRKNTVAMKVMEWLNS